MPCNLFYVHDHTLGIILYDIGYAGFLEQRQVESGVPQYALIHDVCF